MGFNCLCQARKVHTVSPLVPSGNWLQDTPYQNPQMLKSLTVGPRYTQAHHPRILSRIERVWLNPRWGTHG